VTEETVPRGVVLARLQDMLAWGRKNSVWPYGFGLSCCFVEMATALTSKYDIARYGSEVMRGSPRQADLMIVAGTVFRKMAPVVRYLYEQMMEPRWVISMGSCANSGGMYDIYSVVQGVDKFMPVDLYVPGCPPRPEALMEGLLLLRDAVGRERRPLSWVVGPQGVHRIEMPAQRERKRATRRLATTLATPDPVGVEGVAVGPRRIVAPNLPAERPDPIEALRECLGPTQVLTQTTADGIPTAWVPAARVPDALQRLKSGIPAAYRMLYDLTAIDERWRTWREGQPAGDFSVVYQLLSLERGEFVRVKTALTGERPSLPSATALWPNADWYEREIYDLFGLGFEGHPDLRRILMPEGWTGHPLRKEHPARATEMEPYRLPEARLDEELERLRFHPEASGLKCTRDGSDYMFLNLGPQHPGTHGVLRLVLQLDGEEVVDVVPEIGFHHRGAEKMAERQTWHTFIPYTDRVEYLGGVMNNLPYVLAVEKLAGIMAPPRAETIRVMLCELFRLASHLVWYGTLAQDVGALSPVFYMFNDRERIFSIVEAVTGGRMHPSWFRIGGVAADLPRGWDAMVRDFLAYFAPRIDEYETLVMRNPIFRARTRGVGEYTRDEAIDWGVTGPGLRACGLAWDTRRAQPYSGYQQFEFEIPTGARGDAYDRSAVRVAEMRQSLRIIEQCLAWMPAGPYATSPTRERMLHDIETLITHFLNVSWGPVVPAGEAFVGVEATKGNNGYYLISDGGTGAYRARIRTPSFAHIQMVPHLARGVMLADLLAILGSIDFVLSDVDR
jgi:NADH-quinone oxidoreductase subunit B/C/D